MKGTKFWRFNCGEGKQTGYRGLISVTRNGYKCQKWTKQTPHEHNNTPEKYPNGGLGDHNYCRNLKDDKGTFCLTTDPGKKWDWCYVPSCSVEGEFNKITIKIQAHLNMYNFF